MSDSVKDQVRRFWDASICGEVYAEGATIGEQFERHTARRYQLEPYIADFAQFDSGTGKDVLEIGVGMGADHVEWARHGPRSLTGVDLTPQAVEWTRKRISHYGFRSDIRTADAESLPFPDDQFDLVYSWGVLHHTPDTARALAEVRRVLRPGGTARIMMYHYRSIVGYMLWIRYAVGSGRFSTSLRDIYSNHLESPGTKAYTVKEAEALVSAFSQCSIKVQLSFGDLLEGAVGQQHSGRALSMVKRIWPRSLIRRTMNGHGLYLLIEAAK